MPPRGTWDDELLGAEAVAQRLGVDPATVHRWCRQGALPCLQLGPSWRLRRSTLAAFLGRAAPPPTLAAQLQAFLSIPDQVLAVAEDAARLTRLEAAFFQVGEATDGLLLKIDDPHASSHRALCQQLQRQGLDTEHLEATGRLRWYPVADPAAGIATLCQHLAEATDGERTVWAAIDWPEEADVAAVLQQQAALASLVATHPLVVMSGVVEPARDEWSTAADQERRWGALRGVVRYARTRIILSRLVAPPDG